MNKKTTKKSNKATTDFFEALLSLETEKHISMDSILESIRTAIKVAVKKYYNVSEEVVFVDMSYDRENPDNSVYKVAIIKEIVLEVTDTTTQISLEDALEKNKRSKIGAKLTIQLDTKQIGRIAAQSGKNLIHQAINDAVKAKMYQEYQSKLNEMVSTVVEKVEPKTGNVSVIIDKNEVLLFKNEQIPDEVLVEGQRIKVFVNDILNTDRRCSVKVSRTHKDLVKRLFETEVPEIFEGKVIVKSISREAGSRTKIAVWSKEENIDPVGACIGPEGTRVANIVAELNGEKIDVVRYSENPEEFIAKALAPSDVIEVKIIEEGKSCRVVVPDSQLSLAIGKKGQNAKLAARLTGYKIDIKSETAMKELEEEMDEDLMMVESDSQPVSQIPENQGDIDMDLDLDLDVDVDLDQAPVTNNEDAVELEDDIDLGDL